LVGTEKNTAYSEVHDATVCLNVWRAK